MDPCAAGSWESFQHDPLFPPSFNAVHASLIPVGPNRGKVLMWGFGHAAAGHLDWAIVDPIAGIVVHNGQIQEPKAAELFCSSHAWTRDGRLFVAGGWNFQGTNPPGVGSTETWIYDPDLPGFPNGLWIRQIVKLQRARYYPTVVADTKERQMFVLGGGPTLNSPERTDFDDYEVFVPGPKNAASQGTYQTRVVGTTTTQLYSGPVDDVPPPLPLPPASNSHRFFQYPRAFLVSTGQLVIVGMANIAARATHVPTQDTVWADLSTSAPFRFYGSSVRYPNLTPAYDDTLMIAAGHRCQGNTCLSESSSAEWCKATALSPGNWPDGYTWGPQPPLPSLTFARGCLNLVLLPTAGVLALGGQTGFPTTPTGWIQTPELWANGATSWASLADDPSRRGYHGTALLLEDATVYSGGSNVRDWDHSRFLPPYLHCGLPRPSFVSPLPGPVLAYNAAHTAGFSLPAGASIAKVVLMRPGSVTHHFDADQRYVQLEWEPDADGSDTLVFQTPDQDKVPPGYWMLFLVTAAGTPSVARWVQFP